MVRSIVLAGLVVSLPFGVSAQGRGGMASGGHAMAAAPRSAAHVGSIVASPAAGARVSPRPGFVHSGIRPNSVVIRNRNVSRRNVTANNRFRSPQCRSGVPGLGFDEAHLAAVCPNGVGNGGLGIGTGFYFPFFEGGYYMPGYPAGDDTTAVAEAQPQDTGDVDARDYYGRRVRETPAVASQEPTPVNDSDQYIFVRRDGSVFFAVAYAWENGTLRYITSDGLRRTIASASLDLDATQQFNEQRGFSFRLPA